MERTGISVEKAKLLAIKRAAELDNRSVSNFFVHYAIERAREILAKEAQRADPAEADNA